MPQNLPELDCLILAAGNSSRFGGCKLLADWQGRPLILNAIAAAQALRPRRLLMVTGAYHQQLEPILRQLSEPLLHWAFCPNWAEGMGASLAFGAAQLSGDNGLLIMLADQPLVTAADLQHLQNLWRRDPHKIVCSHFANTLSVPAIFPAQLKPELLTLRGDKGAKALFTAHADLLLSLPLATAEFDVDTPADLARLTQAELSCLAQESPYDFAQD